jgi:hypothetical protein
MNRTGIERMIDDDGRTGFNGELRGVYRYNEEKGQMLCTKEKYLPNNSW